MAKILTTLKVCAVLGALLVAGCGGVAGDVTPTTPPTQPPERPATPDGPQTFRFEGRGLGAFETYEARWNFTLRGRSADGMDAVVEETVQRGPLAFDLTMTLREPGEQGEGVVRVVWTPEAVTTQQTDLAGQTCDVASPDELTHLGDDPMNQLVENLLGVQADALLAGLPELPLIASDEEMNGSLSNRYGAEGARLTIIDDTGKRL